MSRYHSPHVVQLALPPAHKDGKTTLQQIYGPFRSRDEAELWLDLHRERLPHGLDLSVRSATLLPSDLGATQLVCSPTWRIA